jgi:hypothetical protein
MDFNISDETLERTIKCKKNLSCYIINERMFAKPHLHRSRKAFGIWCIAVGGGNAPSNER